MEYQFYDEIEKTAKRILSRYIGSKVADTIGYDDEIIDAISALETALNNNIEYWENKESEESDHE